MTDQQAFPKDSPAETLERSENLWRKEIHARVAGYRSSRGRRVEGAFSMRFPFPPAETTESPATPELAENSAVAESAGGNLGMTPALSPIYLAAEAVGAPAAVSVAESEPSCEPVFTAIADDGPHVSPAPGVDAVPVRSLRHSSSAGPRSRRKVIAFPRQMPESSAAVYRLADPITPEQPRILDVPEELEAFPTTPLLDGLQLQANANQANQAPADHIELPFEAVSLSRRLYAGVLDCVVVIAAAAIFGAVTYKMLPKTPLSKPLLLAVAALPIILWAIYQYLFTLYGGTTLGMRMARLRLRTFKGKMPSRRHRRSRVIGLYFSAASLMMGLLWALVDVDALCWHDRISRTYLTDRE